MEENKWKVYAHINKINGKMYIGITKRQCEKRWKNGKGYMYNEYFWNSIQKYGWDNFEHNVIYDNLTEEEAKIKEIELIAKYKTNDRAFGYNGDEGGGLPPVLCGDKNPFFNKTPEAAVKASVESRKGKHLTEAHKKSISKSLKNGKTSKRILCVETGTIYPSVAEVERVLGIPHSNIVKAVKNGNSCGKYHWKYLV